MKQKYNKQIANAVKSFWETKKKQGNVLAGKQLDSFLDMLANVAVDAGVPRECIYLRIIIYLDIIVLPRIGIF